MRVVIAGGGTGGHLFPAISIAEEVLGRNAENEVLFVGAENGIEKQILPDKGYRVSFIKTSGIVGKSFPQTAKAVVSIMGAMADSLGILRSFRPDAVIGVGGYASGPTLLCAAINRIPTAVCEQNSVAGLTNRILSRFVRKIFITFAESREQLPQQKTILTGNPVRRNIIRDAQIKESIKRTIPNVLVLGGSQGAKKLNEIIPAALAGLGKEVNIIHQAGQRWIEIVKDSYEKLGIEAEVFGFTENISQIYRRTDIAICRAGSGTISEITAFGIPSVLVPLPNSTHDHQTKNARIMERNGAAVMIEEKDLGIDGLRATIKKTFEETTHGRMSAKAREFSMPDAASKIVDEIIGMIARELCTER